MTKKMSSKAARRIQSSQDKKGDQKDKGFISRASKAANNNKKWVIYLYNLLVFFFKGEKNGRKE